MRTLSEALQTCCNRVFTCRLCHDHVMVICAICDTEQPVAEVCSNCGVNMGEFFCEVCLYYDDTDKKVFHCDECGICRVGARDNAFHCQKCGTCYSTAALRDNHMCRENAMKNCCPICFEYLFDSMKGRAVVICGHTIHIECYSELLAKQQYRCPICSKSTLDMTRSWQRLDVKIAATPMPDVYQYEVLILCNDCSSTTKVKFHIFGHKCSQCDSYNTRITQRLDTQPEPSSNESISIR